jgi:type II secretory pathway pseudopilin PulG
MTEKLSSATFMRRTRERAFGIVEVMVGVSVAAIGFMGAWLAVGQCIAIARAHRETISATECLLQREEEARAVGWTNLTSAAGIQNNIFNNPPANTGALPQMQETITVSSYPPLTPTPTPTVVQRALNGIVTVVSQPSGGFSLLSLTAVRVDFTVTWTNATTQRPRMRQVSRVIALGGLLQ